MNYNSTHLICGRGEVGQSLRRVLQPYYNVVSLDKNEADFAENIPIEVMHICFPYSKEFIKEVFNYQKSFNPKFTIIHSTVPIGVSRACEATFHPIVGQHPYLEKSILTFVQFFGGENAGIVSEYFKRAGCRVRIYDNQEPLEIGKLSLTTQYALNIEYVKNLKQECDKEKINFTEAYSLISAYNEGYEKLGYPEYKLPILNPILTRQGGHCTIPNLDLWTTEFTEFVKTMNKKYD